MEVFGYGNEMISLSFLKFLFDYLCIERINQIMYMMMCCIVEMGK